MFTRRFLRIWQRRDVESKSWMRVCVCVRLEDGTRKIYGWKGIGKLTRNYDYEVREFDGLN